MEVQVFGKEQKPEKTTEHVGEVQKVIAAVNEYAGDGSEAAVGGVGDGVQYASAERKE
jgi:hypothetical protein